MNIKKFRKNLNKIYALIGEEDVALNSIEKQLVKSYLVSMYDSMDSEVPSKKSKGKSVVEEISSPTPKVTQTFVEEEIEEEEEETIEEVVEETVVEVIEEPVFEAEPPVEEEEPIQEPEPIIEIEEEIEPAPVYTYQESKREVDEELFNFKKGNDISDRLNNLPIADLTRCMGINEYMFTKDELFGGDQDKMVQTLESLNTLSNFSNARGVLEDLAIEFDWDSSTKIKKAKNFIQLVNRRYS